jgi:nucleoside phosphorylase
MIRIAARDGRAYRAIASADTLLKDPKLRDELRDRFGVRAVEMEGSGVQTAAWASGIDILVVRGICDYCDAHKNDIWQNYAALVAAAYARALIEILPDAWFP